MDAQLEGFELDAYSIGSYLEELWRQV